MGQYANWFCARVEKSNELGHPSGHIRERRFHILFTPIPKLNCGNKARESVPYRPACLWLNAHVNNLEKWRLAKVGRHWCPANWVNRWKNWCLALNDTGSTRVMPERRFSNGKNSLCKATFWSIIMGCLYESDVTAVKLFFIILSFYDSKYGNYMKSTRSFAICSICIAWKDFVSKLGYYPRFAQRTSSNSKRLLIYFK